MPSIKLVHAIDLKMHSNFRDFDMSLKNNSKTLREFPFTAWVQSLVGELTVHKPCSMAKRTTTTKPDSRKESFTIPISLGKVIEIQKNQKITSGFTVMKDLNNGNIFISTVQIKELRNRP